METLTTTEGAVLGLVAFGERSGYELALFAERSVEHLWTPSRSQIYKTLPLLVARGLARRRAVGQHGRPDKALYRITPAGRTALREWLDDVEDEPRSGRVEFPLKLFFGEFASPGTPPALLEAYRRFLVRRLERYESIATDGRGLESPYPELVLRHGLARVRATLAWIDEATRLAAPPPRGGRALSGAPGARPAAADRARSVPATGRSRPGRG
jgi:DNA-binding PadR family transcriptional regulator